MGMEDTSIKKSDLSKSKKDNFYDGLLKMDKERATKFIVKGLIIAIIFGTIMLISASIAAGSGDFSNLATEYNEQMYWNGAYGYQTFLQKSHEINFVRLWMIYQQFIVVNISRLGVNIGLVIITLGFIGFATNDNLDSRTRLAALIIAGVVLSIVMFTSFFTQINVTLN
ncbi:MAG: hypothetical protein EAX96_17530 [Candidatus Lokiarchaeota archaeon]|nr:hypothetical protein [Candidatus Lokiarchaeota archaeon]